MTSQSQLWLLSQLKHTHNNRGLFADYYLNSTERLKSLDEWKHAKNIQETYNKIKQIYDNNNYLFNKRTNESQIEKNFIQPVLDLLWGTECYQVKVIIPNIDGNRQPDYAFFQSSIDRQNAHLKLGTIDYWHNVPALGDAKKWSDSLDKERGINDNPTAQICNYLYRSKIRWGILTNGRIWRLYEREKSSAGGIYYEVNLEELLKDCDLESFKYFYLFFRREAFIPDDKGMSFVGKVFQGSIDYATEVGDRLKESVYDALRLLMNGIFEWKENNLDRGDPDTLKIVHENCLIILYRLLFLLYAEDRKLLSCKDEPYVSYSLFHIQQEINNHLREGGTYLFIGHRFWDHLLTLFRLIDDGSPENGIPAYNGGLFSPSKYPHIAHTHYQSVKRWDIADNRIAEVIDMLAYQREQWDKPGDRDIDYNTLDVQHLGSIYEGLLELQPHIANEPMIETLEDGKSVFRLSHDVPNPRLIHRQTPRLIKANEVYLVTNRGERKATGSYYTPKYIVDYIVENTIGLLTEEVSKKVAELRPQVDAEIKKLEKSKKEWLKLNSSNNQIDNINSLIEKQKRKLIEPYLSLKILDPAMGSGHFLVGSADFLSLAMATDPNLLPLDEIDREDPQAFYKRLIVERCLYGVDLNPLSVELAKLSLWLHTVSKDKALSFLDHHLRCGNSLIGAKLEDDLMREPPRFNTRGQLENHENKQLILGFTETLQAQHLQHFLDTFREIMETPSGDAETERRKAELYQAMDRSRDKFRAVANCWLAPYFNTTVTPEQYSRAVTTLKGTETDWQRLSQEKWFQSAQSVAYERRFFHWELEFPEVFFDAHGFKPKDERGFDAVIGNPPYDVIKEDSFFKLQTASGTGNLFAHFISSSIEHIAFNGALSLVVPLSFTCGETYEKIRCLIYKNFGLLFAGHYSIRPTKLFPHVEQRITLFRALKRGHQVCQVYSTRLHRWRSGQESKVLGGAQFGLVGILNSGLIPKVAGDIGAGIYTKIKNKPYTINTWLSDKSDESTTVNYHAVARYWIKAYNFMPFFQRKQNEPDISTTMKLLTLKNKSTALRFLTVINSSLFYYWWMTQSDEFHILMTEILEFGVPEDDKWLHDEILAKLVDDLMESYKENAMRRQGRFGGRMVTYDEFYPRKSLKEIHVIDDIIANVYDLTEEENAFLKNYDLEFRTDEE